MKRTVMATVAAVGLILPVTGLVAASHLRAHPNTSLTDELLAQASDRPGFSDAGGRGHRGERLLDSLDLTDDQMNQIRAIRTEARDDMQTLHENLRSERTTLHTLMAGDATEAELRAQHDTIQTLHRQASDLRFETMLATRNVLNLEQRAELADLMEQRRQEFRDRHGLRGDRHHRRGSDDR